MAVIANPMQTLIFSIKDLADERLSIAVGEEVITGAKSATVVTGLYDIKMFSACKTQHTNSTASFKIRKSVSTGVSGSLRIITNNVSAQIAWLAIGVDKKFA
jgi:ribosomal protein L5